MNVAEERLVAWQDTLSPAEWNTATRILNMPGGDMATAWVGVEVHRLREEIGSATTEMRRAIDEMTVMSSELAVVTERAKKAVPPPGEMQSAGANAGTTAKTATLGGGAGALLAAALLAVAQALGLLGVPTK